MIEATVTGSVCADVPQTSREVGGLVEWHFTLSSPTRDGTVPERVEVSWAGERWIPFDDGDELEVRGVLRICACGASPRLIMRVTDLREVHVETRARYAEACARHERTLRLAGDGGDHAA